MKQNKLSSRPLLSLCTAVQINYHWDRKTKVGLDSANGLCFHNKSLRVYPVCITVLPFLFGALEQISNLQLPLLSGIWKKRKAGCSVPTLLWNEVRNIKALCLMNQVMIMEKRATLTLFSVSPLQ